MKQYLAMACRLLLMNEALEVGACVMLLPEGPKNKEGIFLKPPAEVAAHIRMVAMSEAPCTMEMPGGRSTNCTANRWADWEVHRKTVATGDGVLAVVAPELKAVAVAADTLVVVPAPPDTAVAVAEVLWKFLRSNQRISKKSKTAIPIIRVMGMYGISLLKGPVNEQIFKIEIYPTDGGANQD
jgi:hypothetical protein